MDHVLCGQSERKLTPPIFSNVLNLYVGKNYRSGSFGVLDSALVLMLQFTEKVIKGNAN